MYGCYTFLIISIFHLYVMTLFFYNNKKYFLFVI